MSEVGKIGDNQENNLQKQKSTEATTPKTAKEVVVAINNSEAGAGDASVDALKSTEASSPKVDNKKTPAKRTPSKRMSFIERAQKESEELVKNMGGSLELEGGRRTRSSTRGTPTRAAAVSTPPPTKKPRTSPSNASSTPSRVRARGRKIDITVESQVAEAEEAATEEAKPTEQTDETKVNTAPASEAATSASSATSNDTNEVAETNDAEKSNVENAENSVVDAANSAAADEEKSSAEATKKVDEEKVDDVSNKAEQNSDAETAGNKNTIDEQENNIDHAAKEAHEPVEPPKADSPMDTDEPVEIEPASSAPAVVKETVTSATSEVAKEVTTTTANTTSAAVKELTPASNTIVEKKEPTPEPMEVDSSSKSNDDIAVVETPQNVDVEKETPALPAAKANETENTPPTVAIELKEVKTQEQEIVAEAKSDTTVATATDNAVEEIKQQATETSNSEETSNVTANDTVAESEATPLVNDVKTAPLSVDEHRNSLDKIAAAEPDVNDAATKNVTSTATNKSENDFCEPKIASPPITAANDSATSTPQYCN